MRFWCVCGYLCVYLYMCSSHRSHTVHWILLSPSICLIHVSFHLLHSILMNWNLSLTLFVYILEISYDHDILTIVYWDLCKVQISFGSYFNAGQVNHFFFSSSFSIWLHILIVAHPCTVMSFLPTMELQCEYF